MIVPPGGVNLIALSSSASSTISIARAEAIALSPPDPVPDQPQPAVLGQRAPRLDPVLDVGVHVHRGQRQGALGPGQREQPVQQRGQPLRLLQRRGLLLHRRPGRT